MWALFLLPFYISEGCATKEPEPEVQEQFFEPVAEERFKLVPTQNMWTFIKLDTQTGQMRLLQFSLENAESRFEYDLNPDVLVSDTEAISGRFELYPTQNIYNFILLDRTDGRTWQVQWSFDKQNRFIIPIGK